MKELVVVRADKHQRHDVANDSGYLEVPARMTVLGRGLARLRTRRIPVKRFPRKHITDAHDSDMVSFMYAACKKIEPETFEYAYVYPLRNADRPPRDWTLAIGYYCFDTFTPIHRHAYLSARQAADAALTAAEALRTGARISYALVRPPGHHAERRHFGGFCYLNSAAIAAEYLSVQGTVAMLDIDYHHGNGQQDIFWERQDVLTVSIHAHPRIAYPYFSGYAEETGEGGGTGYNVNFPLREAQNGIQYRRTLLKALSIIKDYDPDVIVVPLGFDPARGDQTGSWSLDASDFYRNGRMIATLRRPIVFVQEGGYRLETLGENARAFFSGVLEE